MKRRKIRGPKEIAGAVFFMYAILFLVLQVLRYCNIIEIGPMWTR